jgi:protein-tyrosine phosphatase
MAEAVFQHMVNQAGLGDQILVDSAGTGSWHVGEPAHRGTLAVLKNHDVPYNGRARQFSGSDLDEFDYVLAMDSENLQTIKRYTGEKAEISLFLSYARKAGTVDVDEVPDPYYDGRFEHVYGLVERGCKALLDYIQRKHDL